MKKKILEQVNEVYSRENPSTYIKNFLDNKSINRYIENRKNFYLKLKLPPKSFKDCEVLDLGSGAGQNTIALSQMGAKCTLVDYDKASCLKSRRLFKKFSKNKFSIINKDIFKFKSKKKFDVVINNGVAHHTQNATKILDIACSFVKKKGFIIYGIANETGMFQRNLMRYILFKITKNEKEIIEKSKVLFKESLNRSIKFSGRTAKEIIADTFINPKFGAVKIKNVFNVFKKHKISNYSTYPELKDIKEFISTEETQFKLKNTKKQFYTLKKDRNKSLYLHDFQSMSLSTNKFPQKKNLRNLELIDKIREQVCLVINDKNRDDFNVNLKSYKRLMQKYLLKISKVKAIDVLDNEHEKDFFMEVVKLLDILKSHKNTNIIYNKLKKFLPKTEKLFKGYNGVGMNYYVGYKD